MSRLLMTLLCLGLAWPAAADTRDGVIDRARD